MKLKELIERLKEQDMEKEVVINDGCHNCELIDVYEHDGLIVIEGL